ncbi:MAG: hypothetical protein ACYC4L_19055 [Chloroflexota bacterium]
MAIDFDEMRTQLADVDWGTGLTRDAIRLRWPDLPREVYMHLPSEKEFTSTEELLDFTSQRLREAQVEEMPTDGAAADGGPSAWGESSTGALLVEPDRSHGVGSGSDPGYTGGGSVDTGSGRAGTSYGNGADETP